MDRPVNPLEAIALAILMCAAIMSTVVGIHFLSLIARRKGSNA